MKRSTLIVIILALILLVGAAAWRFVPRALDADECSPVYHYFVDMQLEGVRVTYIQDKLINDTLRLPVTLLEATTDAAWETLDTLFGRKQDYEKMLNDPDVPDVVKQSLLNDSISVYFFRAHRETPTRVIEPLGGRPDDVSVQMLPYNRCVMVVEPWSKAEERAVIGRGIRDNKKEAMEHRLYNRSYGAVVDNVLNYVDSMDAARSEN